MMRAIRYGPAADQEAALHLPTTPRPPVVCLLHGGFWRMPHGREQMTAVANDLVSRGLAVWNLEYRRLGSAEAGWPATMDDVAAGVELSRASSHSAASISISTESQWLATPPGGSSRCGSLDASVLGTPTRDGSVCWQPSVWRR